MFTKRILGLMLSILLVLPLSAFADSITQRVVFGDSLSDTGNLYIATQGKQPPSPAYSNGLFTDGPGSVPFHAQAAATKAGLVMRSQ